MESYISYQKCFESKTKEQEEEEEGTYKKYDEIISTFPKAKGWATEHLYKYEGFWYVDWHCKGIMAIQNYFKARPSDIILATTPKSGGTWLKALVYVIANRKVYPSSAQHPLLYANSQALVPSMEINLYRDNRIPNLDILLDPRLLATHMGYNSLPKSLIDSGCKIIYLSRNPKDTFVSYWHFINKIRGSTYSAEPLPFEEAYEMFCDGSFPFGPFWDHVLGYWKASLERPNCLLFFKYEEMQAEPVVHLKKLAEFMGCPFSQEEESKGIIEGILKFCSFESMSKLKVNNTGAMLDGVKNNAYFRSGKVGDSANYLTPEMIERLEKITEKRFHEHGFKF